MLINDLAESKITVKKSELLKTLKTNLETHKKDYKEAVEGFKKTAQEKLEEHLNILKTEGKVILTIGLVVPEEYSKEYERIIRMLEMSTAEEITISETQFSQYVMDEWNWKRNFSVSSQMYGSKR